MRITCAWPRLEVITSGLMLLLTMTGGSGNEERRVTTRKAGVLGVLPPVMAASTKAEIKTGMNAEAGSKVSIARALVDACDQRRQARSMRQGS